MESPITTPLAPKSGVSATACKGLASIIVALRCVIGVPSYASCGADPSGDGYSERVGNTISYNWNYEYKGQYVSLSMGIVFTRGWQRMQNAYKGLNHSHEKWYSRFVHEDPYREDIDLVAEILQERANENDLCAAQVALSFVQSLPHDHNIGSYQRYATETFIDRTGDCSDKSVLLVSILRSLGHECIFLESPGHLQVGVKEASGETCFHGEYYTYNGFRYYVAETTGNGPLGASTDVNTATIIPAYKKPGSIQGVEYHTPCSTCNGTGWKRIGHGEHFDTMPCSHCDGRGWY